MIFSWITTEVSATEGGAIILNSPSNFIGVDLFAGAGGLSLGAQMAGIEVALAIELDEFASKTYERNHPNTKMINASIGTLTQIDIDTTNKVKILFGGPPCQGFSISNQKTRSKENPSNWLFVEFMRVIKFWNPDWIVFENVKGIIETANGFFRDLVVQQISEMGYKCNWAVLNSQDFGVPQSRSRFFIVASRNNQSFHFPMQKMQQVTVNDAISDLPILKNGANEDVLTYSCDAFTEYMKLMRGSLIQCSGNLVTRNSDTVLQRYGYIPEGGNWRNVPDDLMENYKDKSRCHTGIYRRLQRNIPSITIGNFRKAMLIHPWENRGLSVREAARLQSFPDWYEFKGKLGNQQQQVGNAVPPLLAKAVFQSIINAEDKTNV